MQSASEQVIEAPCLIYDDPRKIAGIYYEDEDGGCHRVGHSGVTAIVAYREHGDGDFVPWLAVYVGADIVMRVPAKMVSIEYARASQ